MAGETTGDDPVRAAGEAAAELRERFDDLVRIEDRIESLGRDRVEAAADRYRQAHRVLDGYEDDATGTGDFGSYIQFEGEFSQVTEVDDDALAAEAFREASETVDKRRLSKSDFDAAREALEPAGEYVDLLEDRDDAVDAYRKARSDAKAARKELSAHVDDLERVAALSDADLSAPVERLRDPVESYNEAVREAFREFKKGASARETFAFLDRADGSPFVDVDAPPADLREYVEDHAAGEEPLPTLLEYADYSQSKLEHYVDDPGALRTAVAVHRTYIERLDGEPLTLEWPPKPADELEYVVRELVPIVSRIADDETVATLREVGEVAREDDYERLRYAAEVRAELDETELDLIASGEIDDRLATARDTLALVDDVLAETDR